VSKAPPSALKSTWKVSSPGSGPDSNASSHSIRIVDERLYTPPLTGSVSVTLTVELSEARDPDADSAFERDAAELALESAESERDGREDWDERLESDERLAAEVELNDEELDGVDVADDEEVGDCACWSLSSWVVEADAEDDVLCIRISAACFSAPICRIWKIASMAVYVSSELAARLTAVLSSRVACAGR